MRICSACRFTQSQGSVRLGGVFDIRAFLAEQLVELDSWTAELKPLG